MGFIDCEIAPTLAGLGLTVTAADGGPGPLSGPLGPEPSAVARAWHERHGARVLADQRVTALLPDRAGSTVRGGQLGSAERLPADLVVVGVGARPSTSWLLDAPVHLTAGAIDVDRDGRTDLRGECAAGDVTATWDAATGTHRGHEHWAAAMAQGRRVARAVVGLDPEPLEPPYVWSDQYDRTLRYSGHHDADSSLVLRGDLTRAECRTVPGSPRGGWTACPATRSAPPCFRASWRRVTPAGRCSRHRHHRRRRGPRTRSVPR